MESNMNGTDARIIDFENKEDELVGRNTKSTLECKMTVYDTDFDIYVEDIGVRGLIHGTSAYKVYANGHFIGFVHEKVLGSIPKALFWPNLPHRQIYRGRVSGSAVGKSFPFMRDAVKYVLRKASIKYPNLQSHIEIGEN